MKKINTVILTGRLTKDPELRYLPETQTAICSFTLAVDRMSKDKGADFIPVKVFGKQAESCSKYLAKGKRCAVEGRINTGNYKNKDGNTVYTTDIVASRVEFLGSKSDQRDAPQSKQEEFMPPKGFSVIDDYEDDENSVPF